MGCSAVRDHRLPDLNSLPRWILGFADAVPVPDAMKLAQATPAYPRQAWCHKDKRISHRERRVAYIPRSDQGEGHWLPGALGENSARCVMEKIGGESVHLGALKTMRGIPLLRLELDLLAYGWSCEEIGEQEGRTLKHVSNVEEALRQWKAGSTLELLALSSNIGARYFTLALAYDWLRPVSTPAMIGKIGPPRLPPAIPCPDRSEQRAAAYRRYAMDLLEFGFMPDVIGESASMTAFEVLRLGQAVAAWRVGASLSDVACLAGLSEERTTWMLSRDW